MRYGRSREAAARAQDRRDREDTAARLRTVVPAITSLKLELEELDGERRSSLVRYTKLIVVARAPALFEFRCGDADCEGGGHNLTRVIMNALHEQRRELTGEDVCRGYRRNESCGRYLQYHAFAAYEPTAPERS